MRRLVLGVSLFYLTVWVPLAFVVYLPVWYHASCDWNPRCEVLGEQRVERAVRELTRFFLHRGELGSGWSAKERLHLAEVRVIYDRLAAGAALALLGLVAGFERGTAARAALVNIAVVATVLVVVPVFRPFWMEVFHPLLFDNELWRTNRFDLTWYITPVRYFQWTVVLLVAATAALNLLIWLALRPRPKAGGRPPDQS
jgi:hypothetical protein